MKTGFELNSNKFCGDVPTEVQALSSGVTSGWKITTSNSIGTVCGWIYDERFVANTTLGRTGTTSIDLSDQVQLVSRLRVSLGQLQNYLS